MIVVPGAQGTEAWARAKLGVPSASQFHRILTKTGKLSAQGDHYLAELVAERLLGQVLDPATTAYMARGTTLERRAVSEFEFENDVTCEAVGFCLRDDRRSGCSPDRLVGAAGLLEIKCLGLVGHVEAMLGMRDGDHMVQCQGQMWVTGRQWCDLRFYSPEFDPAGLRIERDAEWMDLFDETIPDFCDRLDAATEKLRKEKAA